MKIIKRIYEASVVEKLNGFKCKEYLDYFYTKEEAVKFCTDIVKKRYCEIKDVEVVTNTGLLKFMTDKEHEFCLCVAEYSGDKREYEKHGGYAQAFHQLQKECGDDLYEKLLSTLGCRCEWYDYFGHLIQHRTNCEAFVGYTEGMFSEELCTGGKYRGTFYYHEEKGDFTYKVRDIHYYYFTEVHREPTDDNGYDSNSGWFGDLDECLESTQYSLYWEMSNYFPEDENGYAPDLTEEQDREVFAEKATDYVIKVYAISGNRIRFDTVEELRTYYAEQMTNGNITKDNIYKFLLSLVQYEERTYDRGGHLLRSRIRLQPIAGNMDYDIIPRFSMETVESVLESQERWKEELHEDFY